MRLGVNEMRKRPSWIEPPSWIWTLSRHLRFWFLVPSRGRFLLQIRHLGFWFLVPSRGRFLLQIRHLGFNPKFILKSLWDWKSLWDFIPFTKSLILSLLLEKERYNLSLWESSEKEMRQPGFEPGKFRRRRIRNRILTWLRQAPADWKSRTICSRAQLEQ